MPRFDNNDLTLTVNNLPGSNFKFSAVTFDKLGAAEYTLVTIAIDTSGSISPFQANLLTMLNTIVDACKKSPKADNILVRVITFDDSLSEVHGFVPLYNIVQYDNSDLNCGGSTALIDAVYSAVASTKSYGAQLADQDYDVNAIAFIATDGQDNASTFTAAKILTELGSIKKDEKLESFTTVLIGMDDGSSKSYLDKFSKDAGIDQYVDMGNITAGKLAKLAGFVSRSISSTSQSLGTGSAPIPQSLTF